MRGLPAVEELPLADLGLDFPERRFGLLLRRADGLPNAFPFPVVVDDVLISSFLDSHSWSPFLAMSVDELHDVFRVETHCPADVDAWQLPVLGKRIHEPLRAPEHFGNLLGTKQPNAGW